MIILRELTNELLLSYEDRGKIIVVVFWGITKKLIIIRNSKTKNSNFVFPIRANTFERICGILISRKEGHYAGVVICDSKTGRLY